MKNVHNKQYSILREEEYKKLSTLSINGKILDIGGSKKSGYHDLIQGENEITTVNIDKNYGCDMVFDIQKIFPIKDCSYDTVLSLNVFEHIYNFKNPFKESYRVLKKNGLFIISTPFMFHIHGSPDDYFRYTDSALRKILKEVGFKDIKIEALGFGIFSLLFQIAGGAIKPIFIRNVIKSFCIGIDKFLLKSDKYKKLSNRIPLGYFIQARK